LEGIWILGETVDEEKLDQKARQQPDATKELKDDPWKDFN
jgi:hypothetical protein